MIRVKGSRKKKVFLLKQSEGRFLFPQPKESLEE